MLGFLEGFGNLVAPGGCEDGEARGETLLLKLDPEGSPSDEAGLSSRITGVAGIQEHRHGSWINR